MTSGKLAAVSCLLDGVEVSSVDIATISQAIERLRAHINFHTAVSVEVAIRDAKTMVDVPVDVLDSV